MTVAPLTATVLADADESNAGIASGVNNAIARVAGLIAIAAVGAVVSASFGDSLRDDLGPAASRPAVRRAVDEAKRQPLAPSWCPACRRGGARRTRRAEDASVDAFHVAMGIAAVLVALGGLLGLAGILNPRREVEADDCPGGQLVGATVEAARAGAAAQKRRTRSRLRAKPWPLRVFTQRMPEVRDRHRKRPRVMDSP